MSVYLALSSCLSIESFVSQVDGGLATALKAALAGQKPLQAIKEGKLGGHPDKMGASKA